jgi:hypothetical protein
MEEPEWVKVVCGGTDDELREFILKNPGFDWDNTRYRSQNAFVYIVKQNPLPYGTLKLLYELGGARFDAACWWSGPKPLDYAINRGDSYVITTLLSLGVRLETPNYLIRVDAVRHMLLECPTDTTRTLVDQAIEEFRGSCHWYEEREELIAWRTAHDRRRDAVIAIAWTLSRLTGTQWPDMSEDVARRLMETRVRDW